MKYRKSLPYAFAWLGRAGAAGLLAPAVGVLSADHLEPPAGTDPAFGSTPDRAAYIANIFVWHTDTR